MRRLVPLIVAVLALSACTAAAEPDEPDIPSPFATCSPLESPGVASTEIPDISLPCFTGGEGVKLRDLRGPAVINLWASWCGPCREELPVIQGLADRADGRFTVLGVDVGDDRAAAADFATTRGVNFPTLYDREKRLLDELGLATLPATVFIDADGGMYVHRAAMDVDQLIEQVRKHTGVTVTR
ncbi:TlpA family protein disulfide reductase [Actinoplanes hulinensis]|uniref:TlpA family protein disulfide reductase n=1 Tax=Actinoplanes hulinensis TaxID=1144547 RepID=A0ABS7BBB9_9ACTN|nr:TlpA disulfide reductase family protein [Actinoplanes hulinensis]MBW6438376.1 TlpA family protein disulfide reductase [Actinoplanes hulinensis]